MQDQIRVIYEDKNFLALFKPAGVLVHEARSIKHEAKNNKKSATCYMLHASGTLVDWVLENYPEIKNVGDAPKIRPGIVHRLDKDVSGVILVARNQKYFEYLKNLFSPYGRSPEGRQGSQIKKTYLALVYGKVDPVRNGVSNGVEPKTGIIEKPIFLKPGTTKRSVWQGKMEKPAITEYEVIKYFSDFSLLKVMPKTGRTHQIRIHLSSIGHPIVGDTVYGKKTNPFNLKRIFLHAEALEFSPNEGKRIKIESELPRDLKNIIKYHDLL